MTSVLIETKKIYLHSKRKLLNSFLVRGRYSYGFHLKVGSGVKFKIST